MIAQLSAGNVELADLLFFVAFALFAVVALIRVLSQDVLGGCLAAGAALLALGLAVQ